MSLCCGDVLLGEAQEGKGSGSLFLPTEVCQTGILREQHSERYRCLLTQGYFLLKDGAACSMGRKTEAAEVEQCLEQVRERSRDGGNVSLTE